MKEVGEGSSRIHGKSTIPFEKAEADDIISQIISGMKHLHDKQVIHGDLKPSNILLRLELGKMKVKVTDFGLVDTKEVIKLVSRRTHHFEILTWKAPERFEELLGPISEGRRRLCRLRHRGRVRQISKS